MKGVNTFMLYTWLVVMTLLVVVLFLTDNKQIKKAACSTGLLVLAVAGFVHFFRLCSFNGPVFALGGCAIAVLAMAILTVYFFIKK